ncbi:hypothetical protein GCM10011587_21940 [Pyruvatibacter mobilis]|nr:hypothetical protein GCM10011587_21940 [Pyruvatibacter mobilis]
MQRHDEVGAVIQQARAVKFLGAGRGAAQTQAEGNDTRKGEGARRGGEWGGKSGPVCCFICHAYQTRQAALGSMQ